MVNWSAVLLGAAGCQQAGGIVFAPRATVVSPCQQAPRTPSRAIANTHGSSSSSSGAVLPRSRCRRGVYRMMTSSDGDDDSAPAVAELLQHLTQGGGEEEEDDTPTAGGYFSSSSSSSSSSGEDLSAAAPPGGESRDKRRRRDLDDGPSAAAAATAAATDSSSSSSSSSSRAANNNNDVISTVVSQEDDNAPIDWILSRRLPMNSRRFYRKALEAGKVKVDRRTVKRFVRVRSGSKLFVDLGSPSSSSSSSSSSSRSGADTTTKRNYLFPEHLPRLRVLFEDEHFFAVMKPAGMVCQPCEAAASGTVLHGLLHHMIQTRQAEEGDLAAAGTLSQGIVQRLDKNTSGIMIVAKSLDSSSKFSSLFKKAKVRKEYLAICHGDPGFDTVVDAPLYRRSSGKVGAVDKMDAEKFGAKAAKTRVRNVATAAGLSLCRAEIITGRMHQVRVHLKWMGHPIIGDKEYGDLDADSRLSRRNANRVDVRRPLLHSMTLEFNHPFTNKRMSFRAPIPTDMWETTDNILRASGTREQQEEFAELQEAHQSSAADTAPVGGRGSPRFAVRKGTKGGRGGSGAREAYEAVLAAEADRDLAEAGV